MGRTKLRFILYLWVRIKMVLDYKEKVTSKSSCRLVVLEKDT